MSFVVSEGMPRRVGDVTPGFETWQGPGAGYIAGLRGQSTLTYEQIYRSQPAVYAVVNKILKGLSRLPLLSYQMGEDGESRSAIRAHALPKLIKRPWTKHSDWDLKVEMIFDLLVHGKCLAWKFRPGPGQPPRELWPIPWPDVQPVTDQRGIIGFNIYLGAGVYSISPDDAVYLEMPHGVPPLEPLKRTLRLEEGAIDWQENSLANGVTAKAVFTTKVNVTNKLTMDALRAELMPLYASGPTGRTLAVLGEGSDIKPLAGISAIDLELMTQRKFSREEVCACYDVQPSMLGFESTGQPATYASAKEFARAFYVDTLGPTVTMLESGFNEQLVYCEPMWDGLFLAFDMSALLRPDPEAQARADLMDMQSGTTTINRRMAARNQPPIGDPADPKNPANLPWVAGNGYPLGLAPEHVQPVVEPPAGMAALLNAAILGKSSEPETRG
jgi:HK97 family phage portal protein